ncbi:hypothetical protein [Streptomyces sp. NPDC002133]|uniref:hypothetical protein n=1 Tax=Streptomyces sp. NPDC002133 TaxID=3154409 RepID=UPI003326A688
MDQEQAGTQTGTNIRPVSAAGLDPAFIPGLVSSRPEVSSRADDTASEEGGAAVPVDAAPAEESSGARSRVDPVGGDDDGPAFEVSDRRGAIVAGRGGVTFRLDDEAAEFGWDEIGAVEIDTPRFGRRFGVTVYVSDRRWFRNDVEAPSRAVLKEWAAELDTVLDARFDDSGT